jgi:acyl-CoA dehydrogenase family protein 9
LGNCTPVKDYLSDVILDGRRLGARPPPGALASAAPAADDGLAMTDSLVKRLFVGELPPELVLPYPRLAAERREFMDMFRQSLARFAALKIDSRDIDKRHRIPAEVLDGLAELGLFGIRIPEKWGGLDLDMTQYVRIGADLAALDGAVAIMSGGHSTIGIKALLLYGTEEQQARYLPRLATGELKAAFALSETGAGSDAQSLRCTARRQPDGSWLLNGEKLWITNGGFADLLTVFARTPDVPRADGKPSISCFLVERVHGFRSGPEEDKLGICGSSTTPIVFEDVRVPAGNLVGPAGDGFRIALHVLNAGRTGLSGGCLGAARFLLHEMAAWVAQRQQFGRPIGEFELIRE